ncbi:MAG: SRPBCC family protein [Armatimonadota bacterium]|nr:SRPBCC family protein [Armatimonadota bacterium]
MERKRAMGAMAGAALAATVVAEILRRNGYSVTTRLEHVIGASPSDIIHLVSQVEREPEFIPAVRKVTVLERTPEAVRYRVEGVSPLGAWYAMYHKWWDVEAGTVGWASDDGSFGLRQRGQLNLEPRDGKTLVVLTSEYTSEWAVAGPAIASAGKYMLVEPNFRAWLRNLGRALERPGGG